MRKRPLHRPSQGAVLLLEEETTRVRVYGVGSAPEQVRVPVVNQWVQMELEVSRVPNRVESRRLMAALQKVRRALTHEVLAWQFAHKDPGILLRFRLRDGREEVGVSTLEKLRPKLETSWIRVRSYGSFIEQRELIGDQSLSAFESFLSMSCQEAVRSRSGGQQVSEEIWAKFMVDLGNRLTKDQWWTHECLCRLLRLRAMILQRSTSKRRWRGADPRRVLGRVLGDLQKGGGIPDSQWLVRESTLALLFSYVFNHWGVSLEAQQRILEAAVEMTRPELFVLQGQARGQK